MSEKTAKKIKRDAEKSKYRFDLNGKERWWLNALLVAKQDITARAERRIIDHLDSCLEPEEVPDQIERDAMDALPGVTLTLSQAQFDKLREWCEKIPHNTTCDRALRRLFSWMDAIEDGDEPEVAAEAAPNGRQRKVSCPKLLRKL